MVLMGRIIKGSVLGIFRDVGSRVGISSSSVSVSPAHGWPRAVVTTLSNSSSFLLLSLAPEPVLPMLGDTKIISSCSMPSLSSPESSLGLLAAISVDVYLRFRRLSVELEFGPDADIRV